MARLRPLLLICALLPLAGAAVAQDAPAEKFESAPVIRRGLLTGLVERCGIEYPQQKAQLEQDFQAWLDTNAEAIAHSEAQIAALPDDRRKVVEGLAEQVRTQAADQLAAAQKANVGDSFCKEAVASYGGDAKKALDADSYDGAAGMYAAYIWTNDVIAAKCIEQFPAAREDIEREKAQWEQADAQARKNALARLEEARKDNAAALDAFRKVAEKSASDSFDKMRTMGAETAEDYCRTTFSELAAGRYRSTAPNMYQLLEAGPPAESAH